LIRGGRDTRLQTTSLLAARPLLDREKLLPAGTARELRDAYEFLRRLENRLQMLADEQTHRLPRDERARARIAHSMGVADWPALRAGLDGHRLLVTKNFRAVVFAGASPAPHPAALGALLEAGAALDRSRLLEELRCAGFAEDAAEAARLLEELSD